jgi:hypothetical protein
MDKKPRLDSDPLEWIEPGRQGIRWYVPEDNLKEFINTQEAKWGKLTRRRERVVSEGKG